MKILSILNVSNREKIGCDSGVIFHRLFFGELIKNGYQCAIASPIKLHIPKIKDIFNEPGKNKYDVRFRFDWDYQKKMIEQQKPDILFVNQIELVSNYRALITTLDLNIKIATYYHYIPIFEIKHGKIIWDDSLNHSGLAEVILFRIVSALKTSDYFFVTSQYSKKLLIQACNIYNVEISKAKIRVLPCPADIYLINNNISIFPKKKTILYNSRLYKQYGTDFLIDIIDYFYKKNYKFIVTDFFSKTNKERKKLDKNVEKYRSILKNKKNVIIRTDGDIRKIYKNEILKKASICMSAYRKNANWSMGAMDCMSMGIPVICPNFASFPEFTPHLLLYNNKGEAIALIYKLLHDKLFWLKCSKLCKEKVKKFYPKVMVKKFIRFLNDYAK